MFNSKSAILLLVIYVVY